MRLDWNLIRTILAHVEAETIKEFLQDMDSLSIWGEGKSPWERLDEKQKALKTVLGHFEILLDAGILKNGQVTRRSDGSFGYWDFQGVYISMSGHDLLDALRDKTIWEKIKGMSKRSGVSLSWEFIKAAIPVAIQQALKNVS